MLPRGDHRRHAAHAAPEPGLSARRRAALFFALAGAAAAAVHVAGETPGELRDWRQTVPLAATLGAGLGAVVAPSSAGGGLAAALAALAGFVLLFAIGHALISGAALWPALATAARDLAGAGGAAALVLGALAGWANGRRAPSGAAPRSPEPR